MYKAIDENICPATFPVAVKLVKDGCLSSRGKRAGAVLGSSSRLCQAVSAARFHGWTIVFPMDDYTCPISLLSCPILHLAEEPESCGRSISGKIDGVLIAPLHKAEFAPDIVVIYGNPGQVARLVQRALYEEKSEVSSEFMGTGPCGGEIVFSFTKQKYSVTIPGNGERAYSMIGDEEMYFTAPGERIPNLLRSISRTCDGFQDFQVNLAGLYKGF